MRSRRNRAGYAKSCGAEWLPNPSQNDVSKARKFWERRHQAVPGAFASVPCLALGLPAGPAFQSDEAMAVGHPT